MRAFLPPILLTLAILATAPAMGEIRDWIFEHFPARGVRALALGFAAVAAAAFLVAVAKIRERRLPRYAALAACGLLVALLVRGFETESVRVNVVERIHILEYGLLAVLLFRAFRPRGDLSVLALTLLWVSFAGTLDEFVQWFFQKRTGEIRDVAINALSGVAGLLFALALLAPRGLRLGLAPESRRPLARSAALLLLLLGVFYSLAHLGHVIEDPEIGRFRSFFTAERLAELARAREREWSRNPPTGLDPWAREDYFLTEAGAHANHRNERLRSGDVYMAWQANRILETYYDPFLDIESFRGSGRHRFPDPLRADLESRLPQRDPARYESPVHARRVHTWASRPLFLALLLPLSAALFFLPVAKARNQGRKD